MKRSLDCWLSDCWPLRSAAPASAADLPRRRCPTRLRPIVAGYNWTGFYIGINGGGAWARSDWDSFGRRSEPVGRHGRPHRRLQLAGRRQPVGVRPRRRHRLGLHRAAARLACVAISCETKNNLFGTVPRPRRLRLRSHHALPDGRPRVRRHRGEPHGFPAYQRHQRRLDHRRRRRSAPSRRTGPPRSSTSTPISATSPAAPCNCGTPTNVDLTHERPARRRELPLLRNDTHRKLSKAPD